MLGVSNTEMDPTVPVFLYMKRDTDRQNRETKEIQTHRTESQNRITDRQNRETKERRKDKRYRD